MTTLPASASVTVAAFERTYRSDHTHEHALLLDVSGHVVVQRTGDFDEVKFTPQELTRACMGTLSHNHPRSLPPSGDDLALAARYGLTLRAIGITPDGTQIDYTIKMPGPSEQMSERITTQYEGKITRAEAELANSKLDDRSWQRESRHLAVERLAKQFGFTYTRTQAQSISETRHTNREVARLDIMANVEAIMQQEVFSPLHAQIAHILTRSAGAGGIIPLERLEAVRREASRLILHAMLGKPDQDGLLVPYSTQHGQVVPDSPYFVALWKLMRAAASVAVEHHADLMRRYLPVDLLHMFEYATVSPFEMAVHEMDDEEDLPTLAYDPLHRWIGPDGKTLSDRIWSAAGEMRAKLDTYLTQAIARHVPVADIARELEQFLLPGRGSYEAMRLAVAETTAAYHRADSASAQLNPFVETYSFFTTPTHVCCDVCDEVEKGSPYPKGDTVHLPPQHPWCVCGISWNVVKNIKAVIDYIRQQVERAVSRSTKAIVDFIGPLSKRFLNLLFRGK